MTLTKNNLPKLVLKWYNHTLTSDQTIAILKEIELACEEYEEITESELCDIICKYIEEV